MRQLHMRIQRETFGTKIANHQLVKQKIAEMEADYQMSHLLWLRAGYLKNDGQPNAPATQPGEVAGDDAQREGSVDGDRSTRREWLFKRLSGRALFAQLQSGDHLRGNARHSHVDAGRLGVGPEEGKARA